MIAIAAGTRLQLCAGSVARNEYTNGSPIVICVFVPPPLDQHRLAVGGKLPKQGFVVGIARHSFIRCLFVDGGYRFIVIVAGCDLLPARSTAMTLSWWEPAASDEASSMIVQGSASRRARSLGPS